MVATILAIVGAVIGSGFISGKEVVVFFARFGWHSIPCILIAFFLFFLIFRLILLKGQGAIERLSRSKTFSFVNIVLCVIFSSAMISAIVNLMLPAGQVLSFFMLALVMLACFCIFKKGIKALDKFNLIFVPMMLGMFVAFLLSILNGNNFIVSPSKNFSLFYCILYVILNTSNSLVLIAKLSCRLSRKQKTRVAFLSALVLCLILLLADVVLLQNQASLGEDMPLLTLFDGVSNVVMRVVIFFGCITTLFSLIYTSSSSLRGLNYSELTNFFISQIFPFALSLLGFSFIVSFFYPLASILGIVLLGALMLKRS